MRSDDSQHNSASFFVCNFGHARRFSHDLTPLLCYFFCTLLTPASVSHYLDKCSNSSSSNHINDHVCLWSLMKQCGHFSILPALTVLHHFETIYILVVRSFCKLATPLSCSCHCCFCQFFLSARVQINLQIISVAYQCLFGDKRIWEPFWSLVRGDALHWCVIIVRVLELVLCWQMTGIIMSNT